MTPPTAFEEDGDTIVVRKRAGKTEDRLEIRLVEVLSDVSHEMGEAAGLEKDGVERDLQEELAAQPDALGEELRLVRREWPTDIGPVDLMCRDAGDGWVAVEVKRIAGIEAVEQLCRYLEYIRADPARADCRGVLAATRFRPQAVTLAESRGDPLRGGRSRRAPRRARARADALRVVLGRGQGDAAARLLVGARQVFELTAGARRDPARPGRHRRLRTVVRGPTAARTATRASRRGRPRGARTGNG